MAWKNARWLILGVGVGILVLIGGRLETYFHNQQNLPQDDFPMFRIQFLDDGWRNKRTLPLKNDQLNVSSFNSPGEGKQNLVDRDLDSYWHSKSPKKNMEEWIEIDLGKKESIVGLSIFPRKTSNQLWDGRNAFWEGRNDRRNWKVICRLLLEKERIKDEEWISFLFGETEAFRYYRLRINDPSFFSIAELELYKKVSGSGDYPTDGDISK
jgi:hypothetical protein